MADDENTEPRPETADADTPVKAPEAKKPRSPKLQNSAAEVTSPDLAKSAKTPRTRRKRDKQTGELEPVSVASKSAARSAAQTTGRSAKSAPPKPPVAAPVAAIEEMADLLQLEEENKRLRNLLADKLRGENADLRKRLGLK